MQKGSVSYVDIKGEGGEEKEKQSWWQQVLGYSEHEWGAIAAGLEFLPSSSLPWDTYHRSPIYVSFSEVHTNLRRTGNRLQCWLPLLGLAFLSASW